MPRLPVTFFSQTNVKISRLFDYPDVLPLGASWALSEWGYLPIPMHQPNKQSGITFVELLVSMAIMALVFCFSLPFLPALIKKNQNQVMVDGITNAIQYAKNSAMLRGEPLLLTHLPQSTDWSEGMLMCDDNTQHRYKPGDTVWHEWHWQIPNVRVIWHGFQSNNYLLMNADVAQSAMNGYFLITNNSKQVTKLIVNRLGRVRIAPDTEGMDLLG